MEKECWGIECSKTPTFQSLTPCSLLGGEWGCSFCTQAADKCSDWVLPNEPRKMTHKYGVIYPLGPCISSLCPSHSSLTLGQFFYSKPAWESLPLVLKDGVLRNVMQGEKSCQLYYYWLGTSNRFPEYSRRGDYTKAWFTAYHKQSMVYSTHKHPTP